MPDHRSVVFTCIFLLLSAAFAAVTAATTIGVTYNPKTPNLPSPEHVVTTLQSLKISAVRVLNPSPAAVRAFAYTNISLLLSVPNYLVSSFAANRSATDLWIYSHVLPFHPRTRISLISVGSDAMTDPSTSYSAVDPSALILSAMHNLHDSLRDLGVRTISVSTTLSFIEIMTTAFPPSAAEFQEPANSMVLKPLLTFLVDTNSSLLINLYPYKIYKINSEIPVGFALFEENPFNFRDDVVTGVRYRNLFDMMVDAIIAAMAFSWQENIPVIVAETGWPSETEAQAAGNYAEMYLKGLITHLKSSLGTPLRKEGVAEAYIYELFDEMTDPKYLSNGANGTNDSGSAGEGDGHRWGIMHPNMTMRYNIDFSGSDRLLEYDKRWMKMLLVCLCSALLL